MIYHITTKSEWLVAKSAGEYKPESLLTEGYVHCVSAQHFEQVANFYYKDQKNLVALEINEEKLKAEVRWEESGPQAFPHVYGPVDVSAVENVVDLVANEEGLFEFPFKPVLH